MKSSINIGLSNAKESAEKFSLFFIEKIAKIRDDLDNLTTSLPSHDEFSGSKLSSFDLVSCDEVKNIIKSSSPKSCMLDSIPTPLLISNLDVLLEPITDIINKSLQSGIVPTSFKHAIVFPSLKKETLDPLVLKNYRPISNLSFVSKILEKVVLRPMEVT